MYKHIVVPTTGSKHTWRAVKVGDALADRYDATLEIVSVVADPVAGEGRERRLRHRLAEEDIRARTVRVTVKTLHRSVAATLADHLETLSDALPVMATAAHGRSEAMLGSAAEELLVRTSGPVVVVGPHADVDHLRLGGPVVVATDGSLRSEAALWPAVAMSGRLGGCPWITSVIDADLQLPPDVNESSHLQWLARRLTHEIGREVEFEVLHSEHPARAVADFATTIGAGLIVASTHGRSGLARLALGSVAMAIVHHARCPVVLVRPAALMTASKPAAVATAGG